MHEQLVPNELLPLHKNLQEVFKQLNRMVAENVSYLQKPLPRSVKLLSVFVTYWMLKGETSFPF